MLPELGQLLQRDVSRETVDRLRTFGELLVAENDRQNLIARSTVHDLERRHLIDGAQLLLYGKSPNDHWIDVGSGAGLPGMVIAILHPGPVTLVEPRRLRADFLQRAAEKLDLGNRLSIRQEKIERLTLNADVITGRAVANASKFLTMTAHLADLSTKYVLPKGRKAREELEEAQKVWQGIFQLVPSATDAEASILLAEQVKRRGKR